MGLCPRPHWGNLQRSPGPVAAFKSLLLRGWWERGRKCKENDREETGGGRGEQKKVTEGEGMAWGPTKP